MSAQTPDNIADQPIRENFDQAAFNRARTKAFWMLMPFLFICYVIAYVDRTNDSIAYLNMKHDIPAIDARVYGIASGMFFLGYFLLEIPGSIIVEKWSARKWICRIMITWGLFAGLTAFVTTPNQFYAARFLLGLAEAGFFPGVIVYLTHWFSPRDRAKALAYFFIGSPIAGIISPKLCNLFMPYGSYEFVKEGIKLPAMSFSLAAYAPDLEFLGIEVIQKPLLLGLLGWQWVYIFWAIPAVILGFIVLFYLPDRPKYATWLTDSEKEALENELAYHAKTSGPQHHFSVVEALTHPKVLLLCLAYFLAVTANYGIEKFLPTILKEWYNLNVSEVTWLIILPHALSLIAQISIAFSSDHQQERKYHAILPIILGGIAILTCPFSHGNIMLTVGLFMLAISGTKGFLPVFWSLPYLFLTKTAAAGSIGLINSVGNLGGFVGPVVLGYVKFYAGSYANGLFFLGLCMFLSASILFTFNFTTQKQPK